jgi:hypothetical protein
MNRYPSGRTPKAVPRVPAKIQLPSAICVISAIFIGAVEEQECQCSNLDVRDLTSLLCLCFAPGILLIDLHFDAAILLSDDVTADDIHDAYSYYRHMARISDSLQPIALLVPALFALVYVFLIWQLLSTVLVRMRVHVCVCVCTSYCMCLQMYQCDFGFLFVFVCVWGGGGVGKQ